MCLHRIIYIDLWDRNLCRQGLHISFINCQVHELFWKLFCLVKLFYLLEGRNEKTNGRFSLCVFIAEFHQERKVKDHTHHAFQSTGEIVTTRANSVTRRVR